MQGNLFQANFHVHGTLSADAVFHYTLPCPATFLSVITNGVANVTSSLIVGTDADDNGYITAFTPGANNTPVTKDRGDFNGALVADTAECPHLAAGTTLLLTYTHASASHVDIQLNFMEG